MLTTSVCVCVYIGEWTNQPPAHPAGSGGWTPTSQGYSLVEILKRKQNRIPLENSLYNACITSEYSDIIGHRPVAAGSISRNKIQVELKFSSTGGCGGPLTFPLLRA